MFYVFFSFGLAYLYASVYFPLRILRIGHIEDLKVKEVIYVPEQATRSGDIPAYYLIKFEGIDFSIETSESTGEEISQGDIRPILFNKKLSYGILLSEHRIGLMTLELNGLFSHLWLLFLSLVLILFQIYMGLLMFWRKIEEKIRNALGVQESKLIRVLTVSKEIANYAPIVGILMILAVILAKGVLSVEHIGKTTTGFAIHISSVIFSWSPYMIVSWKNILQNSTKARVLFFLIKTGLSLFVLFKLIRFLIFSNFTDYESLTDMLLDLLGFLVD